MMYFFEYRFDRALNRRIGVKKGDILSFFDLFEEQEASISRVGLPKKQKKDYTFV